MRRTSSLLATACLLSAGAVGVVWAAGPSPTFSTVANYTVGTAPREAAVGDLNGDGFKDIVSADSSSNRVSVLLGKGDGTFNTSYSAATVAGARSVALADFDKDGDLDILATNGSSTTAQLLANDGNATPSFSATSIAVSSTSGLRNAATADFDGDSWPDIAVAGYSANKVGIRLSDGSGGFDALTEYATGNGPTGLVVADVNADTKPDLISFNRNGVAASSTVSVLLNDGSGFFTVTNYGMGSFPDFGAAGDLNGDGKTDFVAANTTSTAGLTVGVNNGSGGFTKGTTYALPTGSTIAEGAALADFNLDGNLDAIVAINSADGFALYLGNGDATFDAGVVVATPSTRLPYGATAADLNADGKPDVILTGANGTPNTAVGVLLNTTVSTPGAPTDVTATAGDGVARIAFTAPAGSGITNYEYSTDNGSTWTARSPGATTSPLTITGLTNGTTYQVKIRAVSSAGSGTASSAVSVKPVAKPTVPQSVNVSGGVLSWSAPNWASSPTAYVVAYKKWSDKDNATVPWGVYAARAKAASATFAPTFSVPLEVKLDALKNKCGATNLAAGWAYCPLPRGSAAVAGGYAMRVYAMNGSTAGPMSPAIQVTP